jgi:alginate O-acetyltransferase complex protein AlgJ
MYSTRNFHNRFLTSVVLMALFSPVLGMALSVDVDTDVLRFDAAWVPTQPPLKAISRLGVPPTWYKYASKTYFDTHFSFRGLLTRLHAWLKVRVFGVSSSTSVTLGKDGWLFYAGEQIVDDYRRIHPFTVPQLEQWTRLLKARHDWLRDRGIPYVVFVAPNPQTLYPEYMPDAIVRSNGPSRLDQLVSYAGAHGDVDILDLRPGLIAAKRRERVYYKTDTHWNQLGGFVAYRELAEWLGKQFPLWRADTLEDFERRETPNWHGGLAYMLGDPRLFGETRVTFLPRRPVDVRSDGRPLGPDETSDAWVIRRLVVRESPGGELETALVFRDSFFSAPAQFLSLHFRRMVLVWGKTLDPSIVERERPDVVIQEFVERGLMEPVPEDPPLPPLADPRAH